VAGESAGEKWEGQKSKQMNQAKQIQMVPGFTIIYRKYFSTEHIQTVLMGKKDRITYLTEINLFEEA
jgi:hypothetical protein